MEANPRRCSRCIMDTTAAGITFDAEGGCNYCTDFLKRLENYQPATESELKARRDALVARIKREGKGKPYDCIVGLSGGADSAYALYLAKESGLRPLAVHMDNGWDSELAANNIENLVRRLGVDLYTHVINWDEYRRLMQAFFDANVIDVELLYDNAMLAVNYQMAEKYGLKWILAGTNTTTEGMPVPDNWNWYKFDKRNIVEIAKRSGIHLDTFPAAGTVDTWWKRVVKRIRWLTFLDYIDYFKPACLEFLVKELGYRPYPYKHYESIFTRFYQGYILPEKFGVDKRKLHLSTLIISGQMSRAEALDLMTCSPYPSEETLEDDIEYFLKKMGWTRDQLTAYLQQPEVPHDRYGSERVLAGRINRFSRLVKAARAKVLGS
jgi:N-acetyl sugar amidotransferase